MSLKKTGTSHGESIFLAFIAVFWFTQYLATPYLTIFLIEKGSTAFLAGLIAGAYGFVQIFVRLPIGALTDDVPNPIRLVRYGSFVMVVSTVLMRFGASAAAWFFARLLAGISAASWVVMMGIYIRIHSSRAGERAIGRATAAQYAGILSAFLTAGIVRTSAPMETVLSLNAAVAVLSFAMTFLPGMSVRFEVSTQERPPLIARVKNALTNRRLMLGSLMFFLAQFIVFSSALSFTTNFAKEYCGAGSFDISLLTVMFSLSTLIASLMVDKGLERFISARNSVLLSFALMLAVCIAMPFAREVWLLCVMQALCGLAYGVQCSVINGYAIAETPGENRAAAMGLFQGIHCIAITFAPALMGRMIDATEGYELPFRALSCICLLGIGLTIYGYRKNTGRVTSEKEPGKGGEDMR